MTEEEKQAYKAILKQLHDALPPGPFSAGLVGNTSIIRDVDGNPVVAVRKLAGMDVTNVKAFTDLIIWASNELEGQANE
jgi:hypothetical protein